MKTFAGFVLVISIAILFIGRAGGLGVVQDDAYMFIRYGHNFWQGHGLAWNPDGVQTYGTTSLLYMGVIIVLMGLFNTLNYALLLSTTSAVFAILTLIVIAVTCWRFVNQLSLVMWLILIFIMILPIPLFRYNSVTGMDTTLSMFCNSLLLFVTLNTTANNRSWWAVLIVALITFQARPDNIIVIYLFPFLALIWLKQAKVIAVQYIISLSGLLIIDAIIKYWLLNSPLPLPFFAKSYQYYDGYLGVYAWNPIVFITQFLTSFLPVFALVILFTNKQTSKLILTVLLPVGVTYGYFFTVVQIMGKEARFYIPFLPFIVFAGFAVFSQQIRRPILNEAMIVRILVLFLLMSSITPPINIMLSNLWENYFVDKPTNYNDISTTSSEKTSWGRQVLIFNELATVLPPNTKISLSEYGYIGAYAPQIYIIDPLGLHSKDVAYHGFSADRFMTLEPEVIWLPHYDYSKIRYEITRHPQFKLNYHFYPHFLDGVAIRKNNPNFSLMNSWIQKYNDQISLIH